MNRQMRPNISGSMCCLLTVVLIITSSCLSSGGRTTTRKNGTGISNNANAADIGHAFILNENPIVESGNTSLSYTTDITPYLQREQEFITFNSQLREDCSGNGINGIVEDCFEVSLDNTDIPLQTSNQKWVYDVNSDEWAQVNMFAHLKRAISSFHSVMLDAYTNSAQPGVDPLLTPYRSAFPVDLYTTQAHWYGGATLKGFAKDPDLPNNARFDPSGFAVEMGQSTLFTEVLMAEDPSIVYHELGHAFSQVLLNSRNVAHGIMERSDIGYGFYDEAGGINEGYADFISHHMNGRSEFAEWGLGTIDSARPVSEDSSYHSLSVSTAVGNRLTYPEYINYNSNKADDPKEVVHFAGMTTSHFMSAFIYDLQYTCGMEFREASDLTLYLTQELYMELGDLTSTASDNSGGNGIAYSFINHNPAFDEDFKRVSLEWQSKVTPVNYRSFIQKFSKYAYLLLVQPGSTLCNGTVYPQDNLEQLLDSYGLLLFHNYNLDGNNPEETIYGSYSVEVNDANRIQTVLIDKDLIKLDDRPGKSQAFIFDRPADITAAINGFKEGGIIEGVSDEIPQDFVYNNGNARVSPGEVVGISLNLYNNSNSTMAGVQVLANDWDHVKTAGSDPDPRPCNNFDDNFPGDNEGAAVADTDPSSPSEGDCHFITRTNGTGLAENIDAGGNVEEYLPSTTEPSDAIHPVCFVQVEEDGATIWATQKKLMDNIALPQSSCLDEDNPHDCFFRSIRGADQSNFSKIDPGKTWGESIQDSDGNPQFSASSVLWFEVNPSTPPGTTFDCRFRVRFSNCSNCWINPDLSENPDRDDYYDYEYSGGDPFKIIHFQFTVID